MTIAATILDMANHPAAPLPVNEFDLEILRALVRGRRTEQRLVQRARIVLSAAEGQPNRRIATELGVAPMTVLLWRARYERAGLAGLADQARPGRPPTYGRDERDQVIALTLEPPSDGTTHWSARRLADRLAMSETTVWRIWQSVGLKPRAARHIGRSTCRLVRLPHRSSGR
jgi:transposase